MNCLQAILCVPGTVLGIGDIVVNERDQCPDLKKSSIVEKGALKVQIL